MRGDEARKLCAKDGVELQLVQVPTSHGKADLTLYRQNSKQVLLLMHGISSRLRQPYCSEQGLLRRLLVTAQLHQRGLYACIVCVFL